MALSQGTIGSKGWHVQSIKQDLGRVQVVTMDNVLNKGTGQTEKKRMGPALIL